MNYKTSLRSPFSTSTFRLFYIALALVAFPNLASAHTFPGSNPQGLQQGFLHPFTGLDHLLTMLAVGLWAMQQTGRSRWAIPLSFVGVMAVGGWLGTHHFSLPAAEFFIAGSLLVLGLLVATSARVIPLVGAVLVGFFALFHGYSHGAEMAIGANALNYSFGFLLATLALHGLGMLAAVLLQRAQTPHTIRFAGAALCLFSIYLFVQ